MTTYRVVLFDSTAHALRAEKVLALAGVRIKLIPTPRQLSADCGLALRFEAADTEQVKAVLAAQNVPTNGIHDI